MSALMGRLKRVEQVISAVKRPPRFVFMEHGETEEAALARAGLEEDRDGLTVFIVSFLNSDPARVTRLEAGEAKASPTVDQEIEEILSDLQAQGLTDDQIETMLVEGGSKDGRNSPTQIQQFQAVDTSKADPPEAEQAPVKQAQELVSLFRRRH